MTARSEQVSDWNAVASAGEGEFRAARRLLEPWGAVGRTGYYNLLAARLADPQAFLGEFARRLEVEPGLRNFVSGRSLWTREELRRYAFLGVD